MPHHVCMQTPPQAMAGVVNYQLLAALKRWRREMAERERCSDRPYMVMDNKTLEGVAQQKPTIYHALCRIKGIKSKKTVKYGDDLIRIVKQFTGLESPTGPGKKPPAQGENADTYWTQEQDAELQRMAAAGEDAACMAAMLGRSPLAIKMRLEAAPAV